MLGGKLGGSGATVIENEIGGSQSSNPVSSSRESSERKSGTGRRPQFASWRDGFGRGLDGDCREREAGLVPSGQTDINRKRGVSTWLPDRVVVPKPAVEPKPL
jgi:hypothetical protein